MLFIENIDQNIDEIKQNRECIVYKPFGMTPLELVNIFKKKCGFVKGGFSGRLDPMAHGASMLLFDDKCLSVKECHELDKTYIFKIIFGIQTTSADLLGFPSISYTSSITDYKLVIESFLDRCLIQYNQRLPLFCSYKLSNSLGLRKPLWWWAKNNRIDEVEIPSFLRTLYNYKIIKQEPISLDTIAKIAIERISRISDTQSFEQYEIIESWRRHTQSSDHLFQTATIEVDVGSGFYIRSLVEDIGKFLDIPTTTLEIERTRYF